MRQHLVHLDGVRLCLWTAATSRPIVHSPRWYMRAMEWYWWENWRTWRKTCPSATLPTTHPTWTDLGTNPDLHDEMLATNCLSHGTANTIPCPFYCLSPTLVHPPHVLQIAEPLEFLYKALLIASVSFHPLSTPISLLHTSILTRIQSYHFLKASLSYHVLNILSVATMDRFPFTLCLLHPEFSRVSLK
jgi:hypothetical protein